MYKLLALSIGSISLIAGKLKIMGGINYFKTHEEISLNDKTILITGGTDGIGWETAKKLAKAKCVIVAGRNVERIKSQLINYKNIKYMYYLDKKQTLQTNIHYWIFNSIPIFIFYFNISMLLYIKRQDTLST